MRGEGLVLYKKMDFISLTDNCVCLNYSMAGRRKIYRIYDNGCYRDFGKQPNPLELQIGYAVISLVKVRDDKKDPPLLKEIDYLRNQIDAEYGLPLPKIYIRDNMCLEPNGYCILLHGIEVARYECRYGYCLCIDTGAVKEALKGEKTKDPVFVLDAIFLPEDRRTDAEVHGYVVVDMSTLVRYHLYKIIKKNITKFLDQCMVNTLINKVSERNPDVVEDLFVRRNFLISDLKIILNWLLEEDVSIRDMNAILETIADNLEDKKKPEELMEKIREKLAFSILTKIADDKKVVHVIKVSQPFADFLAEHTVLPASRTELPYFELNPADAKRFDFELENKIKNIKDKGFITAVQTCNNLRTPFARWLRSKYDDCYCISEFEAKTVSNREISLFIEGELE
jgi:flagellar biosynthesis protein FlhA